MNVNTGRQIVLAARPSSKPQLSDFRLEEVGVPTPRSGQVVLGVLYLSLDPYMRGRMDDRKSYAKPLQVGDVMVGEAVARVIESRHPEYSERDIVLAQLDGEHTRLPMARAFARLTKRGRLSQHGSACSACRGSRLIPACARLQQGLWTVVFIIARTS